MQKTSKSLKNRGFRTLKAGVLSCILAAVMTLYLPVMALAADYDIDRGSVDIHAYEDKTEVTHRNETHIDDSPTVTSSSGDVTQNTVTITAENNATANVTLSGVNINSNNAAVIVSGGGNVNIELDGNNSLTSGYHHAGLEDQLGGTLTINDANNNGVLSANGGASGAGIGGGNGQDASKITINGGTINATGGTYAAGIGGGDSGAGRDITITGGVVVAVCGGDCGAGIGGGYDGQGSNITISGSAQVSAAGGKYQGEYGPGATIGSGGIRSSTGVAVRGEETEIDTTNLYNTGSIKKFDPGTSAGAIVAGTANQVGDTIVGTEEPPADPDPVDPDSVDPDPVNPDPVDPDPVNPEPMDPDPVNPNPVDPDPQPQPRPAIATIVTADDSYAPIASSVAKDADAAFFAAVDMQIEDLLKEINALIAEGKLDEANVLIAKGLKINAGTHQGFNASTLAKIGEASRMGIAVTVNFVYGGTNYSVTIPAKSQIDPASLVDTNGYCGFLNLVKHFG